MTITLENANTVTIDLIPTKPVRKPRPKRERENDEYAKFVKRILRAYGKRIDIDVDGLYLLLTMEGELKKAITTAVVGLKKAGYSWAQIADNMPGVDGTRGVTKAAACLRFKAAVDASGNHQA